MMKPDWRRGAVGGALAGSVAAGIAHFVGTSVWLAAIVGLAGFWLGYALRVQRGPNSMRRLPPSDRPPARE